MADPNECLTLGDKENQSFTTNSDGEICRRVCGSVKALPEGYKGPGLISDISINGASWTALPTTPLTGRSILGVQNPNNTEIKINFATPASYTGWRIAKQGELFLDAQDDLVVYAKAQAGTITITILEIAVGAI